MYKFKGKKQFQASGVPEQMMQQYAVHPTSYITGSAETGPCFRVPPPRRFYIVQFKVYQATIGQGGINNVNECFDELQYLELRKTRLWRVKSISV